MATCTAELQGYPIQISGLTPDIRTSIASPNDITLQFSPSESPMAYDGGSGIFALNGLNTFFMGGTQYTLQALRLCQPKQEGLANFSGTPYAELQFWGIPTATTITNTAIAVFIIPIIQKSTESFQGGAFFSMISGNAVRLVDLIPQGQVVRYVTCLETNINTTINLNIAYWSSGIQLTQGMATRLPQPLRTNGIPNIIGANILSSFTTLADGTKADRNYSSTDGVLIPYMKSFTATAPAFTAGFRVIQDFKQLNKSPTGADAYKCIAINRSRDIQDGKLIVDPKTGKRLDEEIAEANAVDSMTSSEKPTMGANQIAQYVFISFGILFGIGLLAGLIYIIFKFFINKKGQGEGPTPFELATGLPIS